MEETINVYLMSFAAIVNTVNTCCLLFHLASLPLCYRSELAKLLPLYSLGVLILFNLKESHTGNAGNQGDKAQNIPPNNRGWEQLQLVAES